MNESCINTTEASKFVINRTLVPSVEITFNDNSKILINTDSIYSIRYKEYTPTLVRSNIVNNGANIGSPTNLCDAPPIHTVKAIKGRIIDIISKHVNENNVPDIIKLDCSGLMKSNIVDIKLNDIVDITPQ